MGIPVGIMLYPYSTHNLMGRGWVLPMDIKVYTYHTHASTVPAKIVIHTWFCSFAASAHPCRYRLPSDQEGDNHREGIFR
jgi:hypothetical protein